jgi:DNA-damage-inducible protein J
MTTTTVHVEVDEVVKAKAEAALADSGLDSSDVMRLMLIWIASEGRVPTELLVATKALIRPLIPNAKTIEAIEAARRGELSGPFNSIDELFADLHNADD